MQQALKVSPLLAWYLGLTMMADDASLIDDRGPDDDISDEELALLDKNIDDIEDLPGFEVPYNGVYILKWNSERKEINDKKAWEIKMEVMETIKKNSDADPDTQPGTKFSQLFFMQGEPESVDTSVRLMKMLLKPLAEPFNEPNLLKLVRDHVKDVLVQATVIRRKDSKNPEIFRARLSNVSVV